MRKKDMLRGKKVQPTFRLYPQTIENQKFLKEHGVDVASLIDNALERAVKKIEKL